jgi:hypothetical protein
MYSFAAIRSGKVLPTDSGGSASNLNAGHFPKGLAALASKKIKVAIGGTICVLAVAAIASTLAIMGLGKASELATVTGSIIALAGVAFSVYSAIRSSDPDNRDSELDRSGTRNSVTGKRIGSVIQAERIKGDINIGQKPKRSRKSGGT